jgi:hypothetical protein
VADDQDHSIDPSWPVETLALMIPGETPEEMNACCDDIERLIGAYGSEETKLFWLVSTLIDASGKWKTYGQRNYALNAIAGALGLKGQKMRESGQAEMEAMALWHCRKVLGGKEGVEWLLQELPKVHENFGKLTDETVRKKLVGRRKNGGAGLLADLAVEVGLPWSLASINQARKRG